MKVLIADDHTFMQVGLRQAFGLAERNGTCGPFEIVGVASTGPEAVKMALELRPDVMCLDVSLPGIMGFEVARQIRVEHPGIKILFISMHEEGNYVRQGLEVGGNAYLSKRSDQAEFTRALSAVLAGRSYIGDAILEASLCTSPSTPRFTERQIGILQATAENLTIDETASRLGISRKTVEYHRGRLMREWGLKNAVELYRFAITQLATSKAGLPVGV